MPQLNQVHLAVYANLMEWRRQAYAKEDKKHQVLGVAGEFWNWASLTEGDLKFIAREVAKLETLSTKIPVKVNNAPAKPARVEDFKAEEELSV